jgi:DNA-binding transcriptional LysR family regulator
MKNLPMELLRAFVSVAQLGSFTKAGEILGRSQPAVSLQIKRLEELVDETLFTRNGRSLELTEAGDSLYGYANQILSLLPKIVSRFASAYPNITLEVNCELSKNLLSKAGKQNHDLILALEDNPSKTWSNLVKTDDLVWVTSAEHNAHKGPVVPLIAAAEGCIYRQRATSLLDQNQQPWQIVYTIPDLSGIQQAIQEGLGVTVLAKSTVPENLRVLPPSARLPDLGKVGISLLASRRSANNKAVNLLNDFLKTSLT